MIVTLALMVVLAITVLVRAVGRHCTHYDVMVCDQDARRVVCRCGYCGRVKGNGWDLDKAKG